MNHRRNGGPRSKAPNSTAVANEGARTARDGSIEFHMRPVILIALLLLSACGRPMSDGERAFLAGLHGSRIEADRVRIHGRNPLYAVPMTRPARPYRTCRERIWPREDGPQATRVAATALWNRVFVAHPVFRGDFLTGFPQQGDLSSAMFFAHEMTHVWQWQNRAITGYSPLRVASEHSPGGDPYLFEIDENRPFLSYAYEQQAGLVEEFVCCRALDPKAPRTDRLYRLLREVFPDLSRTQLVREYHIGGNSPPTQPQGVCR